MLMLLPETAAMDGRLIFDVALGPILAAVLLAVLAVGALTETAAIPLLRARFRSHARRTRRLASASTRA
jgi:hypothetical protein